MGAIVDSAKNLGYSLETQTKPLFPYVPDEATLAHELSHMWFGDSATLGRWPDIWLHEGFATWSEWIWSEHTGNKSAAQYFKQLYCDAREGSGLLEPAARQSRYAGAPLRRHDLLPRRDDARGTAREDRQRRNLLPDHARPRRRRTASAP